MILSRILFVVLSIFANLANSAEEPKTKIAIDALAARMLTYGTPMIDGTATVAGKTVANIAFGKVKIANNFEAVDEIKKKLGGTATIFVKDGEEFVRISTNVQKEDGSRAIGTTLARNDAYKSVMAGNLFCGKVEILGLPYDTCYNPIKVDGKVIGLYYFGYKVTQ